MTFENLASGLIGAVIGGVIVVWAEQWRWRRENVAAARLVFFEVLANRIMLKEPTKGVFLGNMATKEAWDAEQVRVASLLESKELEIVAKAYRMLAITLETRASIGDAAWRDSFKDEDGQKYLTTLRAAFGEAEAVLVRAGKFARPGPQKPSGWLGIAGGGLVRLSGP